MIFRVMLVVLGMLQSQASSGDMKVVVADSAAVCRLRCNHSVESGYRRRAFGLVGRWRWCHVLPASSGPIRSEGMQ